MLELSPCTNKRFNTRPRWQHINLNVDQYRFQVPQYRSIPPINTVSLRIVCAAHSWHEAEVHSLIASCKRLESLAITAPRNEGGFTFSPTSGRKLPPVKILRLCRYHFGHSPETVWDIWDFSHLESLYLWGDQSGLRPFLLAVPGTSLPRLKEFALSTFSLIDELNVTSWTSPRGLNFLLREFIAQLPPMQELKLDVQDAAFLLPAIIKHGGMLRKLEFTGATPVPKTVKSMAVKDLEVIQKHLPNLVTLELKLNVPEKHVRKLLSLFRVFPLLLSPIPIT